MNKTTIINITKTIIMLYKGNSLDPLTYEKEIEDISINNIEDDYQSYKETELICYLFKSFQYYQIPYIISNFISHLKQISKTQKNMAITLLIEGYLLSIKETIERRIDNEVNAHLYELLIRYYQNGYLDYSKTINLLTKNIINPEKNTGMDIAESFKYKQESIPGTFIEDESLREEISKKNCSKSYSIENKIKKAVLKYLDQDSLTNFISAITENIDNLIVENKIKGELLEIIYIPRLSQLEKTCNKKWQQNKTQNEPTLQLKLFT